MVAFFDSGLGGLSVLKAFYDKMPEQPILYFADQEYIPYGSKSKAFLIERAIKITEFLIDKGATIIVVACNTATAAVIQFLRDNYTIPFVGMEPAIKPAALASVSKTIGVLATEGTFSGDLFLNTKEKYTKGVNVIIQPGFGMVELVEEGLMGTERAQEVLKPLITPMQREQVDQIVLGCTHYPFLKEDIQQIVGEEVTLIDPASAVVNQIKRQMKSISITDKKKQNLFYTSLPTTRSLEKGVETLIGTIVNAHYYNVLF